ncbi:hypothetical protein ASE00_16165 [Sphingomonas sp. Root710]|uniref:alpha/beta hydrolase n=1 Tax=Sphingomonas sp. Root710 TaxID=1736594 RepID=UPI0006F93577|nr:alpha/beta hydrolase-fold protein [Sphingomonas sp. Root710]KRB80584.1 hypothetical protein ASE00_16165 [Sphingomonas sp. Root710]
MTWRWTGLASALAIALAPAAHSAVQPAEASYTMASTQMWDMTAGNGEVYRISVSFPSQGEAPPNGYPVLYVLDGNAAFAGFAAARWIQEYQPVGKMIVVGVGYPTDKAYDQRRLYDLTPAMLDPPPQAWKDLSKYRSGGQDVFLDFLTGKLRTEIGRRFRINPERQSLFGHSLGGIFVLHTLFTRPQAFYSLVAASPSIEWNDQGILPEERAFAAQLTSGRIRNPSRLLVVVGGRDVDDDPYAGEAFARRMDLLSGHGLRSRLRRYEEEGHITVPARSVTDVLRFVSEGY